MPATPSAAHERWSVLLVALAASLWGTDTVLRRPLAQAFSSLLVVFYEHLLLGAALLPVCLARRAEWRRLRALDWAALLGIAWGGSALATLAFTQAVKIGNPTTAALLQKLQPLFTVLLAAPLLGERLRRPHWLYLVLALAGGYLVSFGWRSPGGPLPASAALLAAAAAALWGSCTVLGRYLSARLSFVTLTALRIVAALPFLALLVLLQDHSHIPSPDARQWLGLLWLALVPGLLALLLYYRGLRQTSAPLASIAELCFPATTTLLNWAFLGSRITLVQVGGFVLLWSVIAQIERGR